MKDKTLPLRVTLDREADAAYIYLRKIEPGGVAETVVCEDVSVNLDLDKQGRLIGIEILSAGAVLPLQLLQAIEES